MKKIDSLTEKGDFDKMTLWRKAEIGAVALVIFIILVGTGHIGVILYVFGWLENKVRVATGFDMLLVKGITATLISLLLILPIGGLILSFFPVPQKDKKIKRSAVFAIFAILCFATFLSSSNVFFNPTTGQPLKYYSVAPNGEYKFYSSAGYDPVTGDKLQTINKKVVLEYLNQSPEESGMEANLSSYSGTINNQTAKTICLFIAPKLNSNNLSIVKLIAPQTKMLISLTEGTHSFALINTDGQNIILDPQENKKGDSSVGSVSSSGVLHWEGPHPLFECGKEWSNSDFSEKHLKFYDLMTIESANADFNGHKYEIKCLYYLNVIPKNNWDIYIEDSYIKF